MKQIGKSRKGGNGISRRKFQFLLFHFACCVVKLVANENSFLPAELQDTFVGLKLIRIGHTGDMKAKLTIWCKLWCWRWKCWAEENHSTLFGETDNYRGHWRAFDQNLHSSIRSLPDRVPVLPSVLCRSFYSFNLARLEDSKRERTTVVENQCKIKKANWSQVLFPSNFTGMGSPHAMTVWCGKN